MSDFHTPSVCLPPDERAQWCSSHRWTEERIGPRPCRVPYEKYNTPSLHKRPVERAQWRSSHH